jgi:predicted DNA-binding protein (MmcQ/YjbR family)
MDTDWIREYCLSLKGAPEEVQWETSLLYKIGGKIFAITSMLQTAQNMLSLKADPGKFDELLEIEGILPAPYLARNKWIAIQRSVRLKPAEIKELIKTSYSLVLSKLPAKQKNFLLLK